jgi:hypothetical protein
MKKYDTTEEISHDVSPLSQNFAVEANPMASLVPSCASSE